MVEDLVGITESAGFSVCLERVTGKKIIASDGKKVSLSLRSGGMGGYDVCVPVEFAEKVETGSYLLVVQRGHRLSCVVGPVDNENILVYDDRLRQRIEASCAKVKKD